MVLSATLVEGIANDAVSVGVGRKWEKNYNIDLAQKQASYLEKGNIFHRHRDKVE